MGDLVFLPLFLLFVFTSTVSLLPESRAVAPSATSSTEGILGWWGRELLWVASSLHTYVKRSRSKIKILTAFQQGSRHAHRCRSLKYFNATQLRSQQTRKTKTNTCLLTKRSKQESILRFISFHQAFISIRTGVLFNCDYSNFYLPLQVRPGDRPAINNRPMTTHGTGEQLNKTIMHNLPSSHELVP